MTNPCRPLALAAAIEMIVGVGVATAQTVIVRNAPPGSTIELVLNAATIGSAPADRAGDATLAVNVSANAGKTETDAHIYVDVCGNMRRVLLVEQGMQPPPRAGGCDRTEIAGLFLVRQVTTLVVDVGGSTPTMWLRQGPAPPEWLIRGPGRDRPARVWSALPTGLVLFGGGGLVKFRDAIFLACGNVTECGGDDFPLGYTAGAAYWFSPFLAAEASYMTAKLAVNGRGDNFRFNSFLDTDVLTVVGKGGVPLGPVRLYGQAGANYHRATSGTTQTLENVTGTTGAQTFELRTAGWGWLFGGGAEAWVAPSFAIYGEVGRAALKGAARDNGEGAIDDRLTVILLGARVRIGR